MDYRKIIGFGKSSFVISLPKDWVRRHNLAKGSTVTITEENESILISPAPIRKEREEGAVKTITTKGKSEKHLQREIISAYITGYERIVITGDDLKARRRPILDAFSNLIALEVVKQDEESIVAKDFLDIEDIELRDLIRKIDNNIRSMFVEAGELLEARRSENDVEDQLRQIKERDDAVNKLAFLGFRAIKELLMNPSKTRESMIDLFQSWTTVLYLERTGDEVKRFSRLVAGDGESSKDLATEAKLLETLYDLYKQTLTIYYERGKKDRKEKSYALSEQCRLFQQECKEQAAAASHASVSPIERLVNGASYLEEILRLTYDFL